MLTFVSFLFAGAVSGVIIAYAMDMKSTKELIQGAVGGLIAGLLMALMLPR
ncbi:MAG: hypothetical protein ONB37_02690 [candidate division KSB1 bacterium]|nr:hypothetical protein [candidate division KSB1 bacterium]